MSLHKKIKPSHWTGVVSVSEREHSVYSLAVTLLFRKVSLSRQLRIALLLLVCAMPQGKINMLFRSLQFTTLIFYLFCLKFILPLPLKNTHHSPTPFLSMNKPSWFIFYLSPYIHTYINICICQPLSLYLPLSLYIYIFIWNLFFLIFSL